ncbi:hypothetical protein [Bacillus pumilus]|uniref:hypothetical protein n=1 Tax=Bacillus pumilus TaxID=1408 RepID=UPI001C229E5A|nr:hypothetical protein [Bacillus pumilus]MBU8697664.1 hypothetical protein [Bacillus pumilus]
MVNFWLGREGIIGRELGLELKDVQYEKHYPGMRIDMYAHDSNLGTEVFVENLLLKSDKTHQKRILKIIDMIGSGIIVYIASAFHDK